MYAFLPCMVLSLYLVDRQVSPRRDIFLRNGCPCLELCAFVHVALPREGGRCVEARYIAAIGAQIQE